MTWSFRQRSDVATCPNGLRLLAMIERPSSITEEIRGRRSRRGDIYVGHNAISGADRVAFVYSGMGPQWWAMGQELFKSDPVLSRNRGDKSTRYFTRRPAFQSWPRCCRLRHLTPQRDTDRSARKFPAPGRADESPRHDWHPAGRDHRTFSGRSLGCLCGGRIKPRRRNTSQLSPQPASEDRCRYGFNADRRSVSSCSPASVR